MRQKIHILYNISSLLLFCQVFFFADTGSVWPYFSVRGLDEGKKGQSCEGMSQVNVRGRGGSPILAIGKATNAAVYHILCSKILYIIVLRWKIAS